MFRNRLYTINQIGVKLTSKSVFNK